MTATKFVYIDTVAPKVQISYIENCDRLFSVNDSFTLQVHYNTMETYAKYTWYCTDTSTGSPCFTTAYSYISIANNKQVTITSDIFFGENTYIF